ncbi:hypothetical protein EG329_008829 [Mollisiaceae sp. DMI_Dod_QoI]|nr:hypothetical protein EG329_008829 [Helotiales sp. DMI_Dod_QoI]
MAIAIINNRALVAIFITSRECNNVLRPRTNSSMHSRINHACSGLNSKCVLKLLPMANINPTLGGTFTGLPVLNGITHVANHVPLPGRTSWARHLTIFIFAIQRLKSLFSSNTSPSAPVLLFTNVVFGAEEVVTPSSPMEKVRDGTLLDEKAGKRARTINSILSSWERRPNTPYSCSVSYGENEERKALAEANAAVQRQLHTSGSGSSSSSKVKPVRTSSEDGTQKSDKGQDFEQLIRSDQTIQFTLTPQNMRDIETSMHQRRTIKRLRSFSHLATL